MRRDNLAAARARRGLTQEQAAENIGISTVYLRKLESGYVKPGRRAMVLIEQYYGVSMRELFPDIFLPTNDNEIIKKEA